MLHRVCIYICLYVGKTLYATVTGFCSGHQPLNSPLSHLLTVMHMFMLDSCKTGPIPERHRSNMVYQTRHIFPIDMTVGHS